MCFLLLLFFFFFLFLSLTKTCCRKCMCLVVPCISSCRRWVHIPRSVLFRKQWSLSALITSVQLEARVPAQVVLFIPLVCVGGTISCGYKREGSVQPCVSLGHSLLRCTLTAQHSLNTQQTPLPDFRNDTEQCKSHWDTGDLFTHSCSPVVHVHRFPILLYDRHCKSHNLVNFTQDELKSCSFQQELSKKVLMI